MDRTNKYNRPALGAAVNQDDVIQMLSSQLASEIKMKRAANEDAARYRARVDELEKTVTAQKKIIRNSRCFPNDTKLRYYRKEIGILKGKVLRAEGVIETKKKALRDAASEKDALCKDKEALQKHITRLNRRVVKLEEDAAAAKAKKRAVEF